MKQISQQNPLSRWQRLSQAWQEHRVNYQALSYSQEYACLAAQGRGAGESLKASLPDKNLLTQPKNYFKSKYQNLSQVYQAIKQNPKAALKALWQGTLDQSTNQIVDYLSEKDPLKKCQKQGQLGGDFFTMVMPNPLTKLGKLGKLDKVIPKQLAAKRGSKSQLKTHQQGMLKRLKNIKIGPEYGLKVDPKTKDLVSAKGLRYIKDDKFGTRAHHVLSHKFPLGKYENKGKHSIFAGPKEKIFKLIDEAWEKKGKKITSGSEDLYIVDLARSIGSQGESKIKLVLEAGTKKIITAYPVE